ncbi:hypothetical protein Sango_2910500 [Sesamum angolense]|uniref:Reverse transcriptase zinc-binding domain-containing protein n=1 Tax=Sesamum angolense TaxID=2727404 RepID=A0AAE1T4F0_9LAMI|nr:hypothetical protein Sango_2910500 [Sesamum angolense]
MGKQKRFIGFQRNKICSKRFEGGLGFRDFRHFNTALLAKQALRIISEPTCILSKVMEVGYFHTTSFFEVRKSWNTSYAWQGIFGTGRLIEKGCRWLVGDGRSIRIWHDRWVPREYMFKVISPPSILDRHATVSQLRSDSGRGTTDTLIRHRSKKGKFSVRAAYNLACDVSRIDSGGPSRMDPNRDLDIIWKTKVPARVELFGWKACSKAIPTVRSLLRNKVSISTKCPQCDEEFEDVKHCLVLCHAARITWTL